MSHWSSRGGKYQPKRYQGPVMQQPGAPPPPLGPIVARLFKHELGEAESERLSPATITDCEFVASYNWLNEKQPAILLPGKPPKWTPPTTPTRLNEDNGSYLRDRNAACYPAHPLEPAVIAALTADPGIAGVTDVVACSSTMGNLLRFARDQEKDFRILVEKVGETIFLVRRENSPTELIPNVRGYGHTFPEAYTTWEAEVKGSCSHQRVLRYKFGGLGFLLRFEADGYLEYEARAVDNGSKPAKLDSGKPSNPASVDDLIDLFPDCNVAPEIPTFTAAGLAATERGSPVPQSRVFDLKTRAAWKKIKQDTLEDEMGRLWVSQVPNFVMAYHDRGIFGDIEIKDVRDKVKAWEKANAGDLGRLAVLVRRIVAAVGGQPDSKLELYRTASGPLELRGQLPDAGDALSPAIKFRWTPAERSPAGAHADPDEAGRDNGIDEKEENSDSDSGEDFTACSADCGYCGRCRY